MSLKIDKIYTDNPYVDEMVYYTKLMGADTVLKMQGIADQNETLESLKNAELYISCVENNANSIRLFPEITVSALQTAGITDTTTVNKYRNMSVTDARDEIIRVNGQDTFDKLMEALRREYIENYVEMNPYYRALNGLPKSDNEEDFDYVEDWIPPSDVLIDLSKPVHMMNSAESTILDQYGILDDMVNEDPINRQYMLHLGKKKIDYYTARKANRFDTLYIPPIDSDEIYKMYKDKLDTNKFYVLRTVYSEAFKYNSDYYDNFISILIVIITMVDIISRVQEFITRKEIFDIRSVQYIFKSYGVPFFESIPLKYQVAMVKNLHTLLKYKSTSKCMVDICSLFGFNNIKIFKYYLLRDRRIDLTTGEYITVMNEDGTEDYGSEYELKFLKLPLEDDLNDYIRVGANYIDYDEITDTDPKWDGGLDHDEVIKAIVKEEFNFIKTKYISIDTIYDIAKMSIQQTYFLNFLFDNVDLESMLTVQIPYIEAGTLFNIADVFTLLTVLTYYYNGVKDTILDTQSKVLYVNGFNFKADLEVLAAEIGLSKLNNASINSETADHIKQQLENFQIPKSTIPSFNEMIEIYVNNIEVREELVKGMQEADNKKVYDIYKKLYDALMTVELTMDFYKNPETGDFYREEPEPGQEIGDATYTEYLKNTNTSLYNTILEVQAFEEEDSRNQYIANLIDSIIYALEEYIDTTEFQSLFSNLPVMSSEYVKQYIATVINFYKSYKVDFLGINTIYTFDDRNDGIIKLIDEMKLKIFLEKPELVSLIENFKKNAVAMEKQEKLKLIERIYLDVSTWVYKNYNENINLTDGIYERIIEFFVTDILSLDDKSDFDINSIYSEIVSLYNEMLFNINLTANDNLGIADRMWIYDEEVS